MGGGTGTGGTPEVDPIKQWIIVRTDLNMRKGKMIAQGSHASMAFLTNHGENLFYDEGPALAVPLNEAQAEWIKGAFTKICLRADSEQELVAIHEAAKAAGLVSHLIEDAGLTEFHGVATKTAVAIGPDYKSKVYPIVKDLELL